MASKMPAPKLPTLTQYVTLREVAEALRVDRATVRRTMRRAGIPALEFGGCIRYRKMDVERYLTSQMEPAPSAGHRAS